MTFHLFGAIMTAEGIASNNRGENAGNVSTLQKILRKGDIFSTVSAEAIRYAIREYWTSQQLPVNRKINSEGSEWQDTGFASWEKFVDNDLLGFMDPKKETTKRRGLFEITRAISTRPWTGDTVFSVASVGAQPKQNTNPVPYSAEVHATRYQYLFSLTPEKLAEKARALYALDAVQNLSRVAGNHSRYLYEFAPDAVVLRWTHDPVPRMMYCFEESEFGEISANKLIDALRSGDIEASEVVAGGQGLKEIKSELEELGVSVHLGVKAAFAEVRTRIIGSLGLEVA